MMSFRTITVTALIVAYAAELILTQEIRDQQNGADVLQKRSFDDFVIYNRKRNAHACIMSIVFIVLYPLGAIGIHLPIDRIPYLRNSYLRNKVMAIHAPIQIIAFVMMVGGMALGIRIGHDLGYLNHPVHAHVVIGLLVVCTIIVFQPAMGILQHLYFKKTGGKSIFAYLHRWIGRGAIALGMINSGLGFQLASHNIIVPTHSYVRSYVLLGVLVSVWLGLVVYDDLNKPTPQQEKHVSDGGDDVPLDTKPPSSTGNIGDNEGLNSRKAN